MESGTSSPKPWSDTPLALIPTPVFLTKKHDIFTSGASHMCMVHNSIFRGYNSIYHQAPHVTDSDKPDFVKYCLTWHKFLKTHAENEETSLFLRIEEILEDKTLWEKSHEEHELFMPGIAKFEQYLTNLPSPKDFSGSKLLEIMATFQQPFEDHMQVEITTIANLAQHPRTPKEGSQKEKSENAAIEAREGKNLVFAGVTDVLPFFLFNFDREYEDALWRDWPIPAPVRWTFISVARVLHPGLWKFASCDAGGQRRELYAVPDSKS